MKKIAIYSRKSVKGDDSSVSIESQIDIIKKYFDNDISDFEIFIDDGFSGGNTNRPAFKQMMEFVVTNNFDAVACYKLDRIARNTLDFLTTFNLLKDHNIDLICVEDNYDPRTPSGRMMMTLLASLAEMERENIKQRVSDSMFNLAKQGRWSGGTPPFGYKVVTINNGKYLKLEDPENIKYIFSEFANGKGIIKLSNEFNCNKKKISRILKNITYLKSSDIANKYLETKGYTVIGNPTSNKGYLPYGRYKVENGKKRLNTTSPKLAVISNHESVIDFDLFFKVQERLKLFEGHIAPRISQKSFLAQMVKCKCGATMLIVLGHKRKDGTRKEYFSCPNKCGNKYIDIIDVENDVLSILKNVNAFKKIFDKKVISKDTTKLKNSLNKKIESRTKVLNGLLEKLALANSDLSNLFLEKIENLNIEIQEYKNQLINLDISESNNKNTFKEKDNARKDFIKNFDNMDMSERQSYIRSILNYIVCDSENTLIY
ncbi:recombinase family protein [Clostridium baratii]|uniref:recombinase family protein n=1 Tax=Clostridium baratii TaxID=1561 RepID=UPI0030CDE31C